MKVNEEISGSADSALPLAGGGGNRIFYKISDLQ